MRQSIALLLGLALPGCTSISSISTLPTNGAPSPTTTVNYSRLEQETFVELNRARTDPKGYATRIEQLIPLFNGRLLQRPGWPAPVQTNEGAAAAREAVSVLRLQPPVGTLTLVDGLSAAARELVRDQGRTGDVGHTGSDGSTTASRIAKYGTWLSSYNENIDYGSVQSGADVIEDMLIDDGVAGRGHRHNVYDTGSRAAGVACGPHPRYGSVCVMIQAGGFTPRP